MSFVGATENRNIKISNGRVFRLLLTQQDNGLWVATVLFTRDGTVDAHHECATKKEDAYMAASNWVLADLDKNAVIDLL